MIWFFLPLIAGWVIGVTAFLCIVAPRIGIFLLITEILSVLIFGLPSVATPLSRCRQYIQQERVQHTRYFGNGFPYWYGVGQIQQESACRPDITAFDGGMGLSQFMPVTEKDIEKRLGEELNPYNPLHAIRMQAFYMSQIHKRNNTKKLWLSYSGYNSGEGTIRKEMARAIEPSWEEMKKVCKRKIIKLRGGKHLDLCEVGYDYPKKIYGYGQFYKTGADAIAYW